MKVTEFECAERISRWINTISSPETCRQVASDIGYNNAPFFGAAKKRARLLSELVMLNTALAIGAINQRFDANRAKAIIDPLLATSRRSLFVSLEQLDHGFQERYTQRMAEYFGILRQDKAVLGLSFSFMRHLGIDPLNNLTGQMALAARFGASAKGALGILDSMSGHASNPVSDFEREIAGWPVKQAKIALELVSDILKGRSVNVEERASELTFEQFRKVSQLLRRIGGSESLDYDDFEGDFHDDDDIERSAQRYHDQIDAQIEASYRFFRETFGEDGPSRSTRRYSLKTLSVFAVHIATLVAAARDFPHLHRSTLNGFTRTLSFRTENTMPDIKPPEGRFVSYAGVEESVMHRQTEVFDTQGVGPLIQSLLQELGCENDDHGTLFSHIQYLAHQASRTYLPHLAED